MTIEISNFINIKDRVSRLGLKFPEKIAIMPVGLEDAEDITELRMLSESSTLKKIFRLSNIETEDFYKTKLPFIQNNSYEWLLPTLFFASSLISGNPELITICLNVVSNYLTDFFKGNAKKVNTDLNIVIETPNGKCKKINYKGPIDGLKELPKIIKEASIEK